MLLLEYESGRREIYLTAKTTNGRCVTSKDAAELMESVFLIPPGFRQRTVAVSSHAGMKQCGLKKKEIIILPGVLREFPNRENATRAIITVFVSEAAVR